MLIIFGGLPGSGKSSIAYPLAKKLNAVYLRIDTIENAIDCSALKVESVEDAGYLVAYDIAKDNLGMGLSVVADSVNPIALSREGWRHAARAQNQPLFEIEIFCSDKKEHKRRIDRRNADKNDTTPTVTWENILQHDYTAWVNPDLRLDTAQFSIDDCLERILYALKNKSSL